MLRFRQMTLTTALATAMAVSLAQVVPGQTLEGAMADYREGDVNAARKAWANLAEGGNADALFNLGQIYRYGYGVEANLDVAALYLTQASSIGHFPAQRELANMYFFDIGTGELKRTAINLWQTAARNGDGRAQYTLGVLFFTGDMVPRNQSLGFAWTLLATEAGVPEAIQLQTAMRAQLTDQDLQKGLELAGTLMTGAGNASNHAVLVNEMPQIQRRQAPVRTAVAEPEPNPPAATPEPEPEETSEDTVAEAAAEEPEEEQILVADAQPDPEPESEPVETAMVEETDTPPAEDEPAEEMPEEEAVVFVEVETEEQTPPATASGEDEFNETRQVLASLIAETGGSEETSAEPAPSPVILANAGDPQDLGDPDSPLVDSQGFGNDWSLQLTSFRKPENAEAHWQDMLQGYSDLFMGLEKRILRFNLGPDKGVYYRLRVGPFASKEIADQKCVELSENELGCLVIWP